MIWFKYSANGGLTGIEDKLVARVQPALYSEPVDELQPSPLTSNTASRADWFHGTVV